MTVHYLGDPRFRAFTANGVPLAGGKLHTFAEATSTPKAAFSENTGTTPHANPIVLDANGEAEIWLQGKYKLRLDDSTDVQQWTMDGISGVGFQDAAAQQDEWTEAADTPTHIDNTNYSVPGDKRGTYQVGRRVRASISAGTVYGTITASVFTSLTTVTVVWDSGNLDAGLSALAVGFLSVDTDSVPGVKISEDDWTHQGNVAIDGTLTVTGAVTMAATLAVTGRLTAPGMLSPGAFAYSLLTTMDGWKLCFGQTIGSAASGATDAADANETLYVAVYDACDDAECPVSTGRGANAAADFAANKTLTLPDGRGRGLLALDNMGGADAGVVTDSEAETMGDVAGAEDVTIGQANLPAIDIVAEAAHTHPAGSYVSTEGTLGGGGTKFPDATSNMQTTATRAITGTSGAGSSHVHALGGSGTALDAMSPYLAMNLFVRI